jgi:transcription initiation factor TFIID TATA-box-binding protein
MNRVRLEVKNLVVRVDLGHPVDLNSLAASTTNADYDPGSFPGLIARTNVGDSRALIFKSGKAVLVGLRRVSEIQDAVQFLQNCVGGARGQPSARWSIVNCVATGSLGFTPNFERFLRAIGGSPGANAFQYNFDAPRSLIYHGIDGSQAVLLSRHGRLTVVGSRSLRAVRRFAQAYLDEYGRTLADSATEAGVRFERGEISVGEPSRST